MPNLTEQQFVTLPPEGAPTPRRFKLNRRQLIIVAIVVGVVIVGVVVGVFVANLIRERREAVEQKEEVMEEAERLISVDIDDCEGEENQEACLERLRSEVARDMGEAAVCEGLEGDRLRSCVSLIAYDQRDPDICSTLLEDEQLAECEDLVLAKVAYASFDLTLCDQMNDEAKLEQCRRKVTTQVVALGECEKYGVDQTECEEEEAINAAVASAAAAGGDLEYCQSLGDEGQIESCVDHLYSTDQDGDGLILLAEGAVGSSDAKADTDSDGLGDYDEVTVYQTDPTKPDTDGDGYDDGTEVATGHDPLR